MDNCKESIYSEEYADYIIDETGCGGILANIPASGTAIIEKLNEIIETL